MSIVLFKWYETEIDDQREITENKIINKIKLKTSRRMPWSELRLLRPVPQWNDEHPNERGFYLDFVKPVHKSRLIWELDAEYTPFKGKQKDPNPLQREAKITFDVSLVEQPTLFDWKDRPICNTAGEFIEGITAQIPIVDYSITKNLPSDPAWLLTHLGGVNEEPISLRGLTWPKKTLLLAGVSAGEIVTEDKIKYSEYKLKILADIRTWEARVWNRGTVQLVKYEYTELTGNGSKDRVRYIQVPIKTGDPPEYVDEPVPLDENGKAIEDYLQPSKDKPIKEGKLIPLPFDVQKIVPFKKLPLV